MSDPLLRVENPSVQFDTADGVVRAVDDVSFTVEAGEIVGLVGESGAGKSVAVSAILRLVEAPGQIVSGRVEFDGETLLAVERNSEGTPVEADETMPESVLRDRIRGLEIAIIFQDPMESLNPVFTVGAQLREFIELNRDLSAAAAREAAVEMLREVGIPEPAARYDEYPHQFSGGMRQRVLIAMALACEPALVIAAEPTTALDVTVEAQILELVDDLQARDATSFVWVTHDMGVVAELCDRVNVMYLGEIVEQAGVESLFYETKHPYTEALLDSIPVPDPQAESRRSVLEGDVPSPIDPPSGCRFRTRCPVLIAPEAYDLTDEEWAAIRAFTRHFERRDFAETEPAALRERFFPTGIPRGPAGDHVEAAIEHIANGEWSEARSLLTEQFADKSICAREEPAYEVDPEHGAGRHDVACHRCRPERS